MRVGLVCPYDMGVPGGVQDQVVRLAGWLRQAGHEATIIAPGESDLDGFVSVGDSRVVPVNGSAAPVALGRGVAARVRQAIAEVDVVNVHEPLVPQVSLTALRDKQRPLVGTFHADTSAAGAAVYRFGRPLIDRWLRNLDVLTAVSPLASRVVDHTGRVRIIPNGIDVADYAPTGGKTPGTIVFLGRNDERKGLPVLLEAWQQIYSEHPNARLTVVGSEPLDEVPDGVRFVGRVSEEDKRRHLGEAAIYCAPNLGGESFGIVVIEGMAAGCAVVASGLPAFVRVAGDSAEFVAPGDADGLARCIGALLSDDGRIERMGKSAMAEVARFDGSVVAASYITAYQDALERGARRL